MPSLRVIVLWHQHQPFYKDLVTGEYRLPWVRLHALKDYYGMVKLLDEFPTVHQTFNLVPSLITQIQDYAAGTAQDAFLRVAAKPAHELTLDERRFALTYLFHANPVNMIGRYPRYQELWDRYRSSGDSADRAEHYFRTQDYTDLQVLSQIAWFDEFFLEEAEISALVKKAKNYSLEDQAYIISRQGDLVAKALPAHAAAAKRGGIEISTSPFYHPILPLVVDTDAGGVSSPGLPLPQSRFRHPEDAREQLLRGLDLHHKVFGIRPAGVWPSEGSVSEEVLAIAHNLGVTWMATDEGVLGRSSGTFFSRDGGGRLPSDQAEQLYNLHRYENGETRMHMVFRDHTLSDLVGFVYSGMPPLDAAHHLINNIKQAAQPVLAKGRDAVVPVILDGENAWEYYPKSGREFLRRFYDLLAGDDSVEAVTMSEAISRHRDFGILNKIVPGSWINANFNVWIGAPEDNRSWDYLSHARNFYAQNAARATEEQRKLAFEEILISEGSDWNWWYGPEHHSANDRDFDELYRKHLSNVYQALGAIPPDYLAQPLFGAAGRPTFTPQMAFVHPRITGDGVRYFEWIGAARYTADQRSGAMHGKTFLLDAVYAGLDEENVYGRLDFVGKVPESDFELVVNLESWAKGEVHSRAALRLEAVVQQKKIVTWRATAGESELASVVAASSSSDVVSSVVTDIAAASEAKVALVRNFEFRMPLSALKASITASQPTPTRDTSTTSAHKIRLRFSLWQNRLPVDALPLEGWIDLDLVSDEELKSGVY
jgi:alpha-amylase/alpha-mannosidase (GH57 family)